MMHPRRNPSRSGGRARGTAVVAVIITLIIVDLIVVGITLGLSRDHDLTVRRLETVRAAYAAEAGINMAIREMLKDADQDGDGTIGEISDDGNAANDPGFDDDTPPNGVDANDARFYVSKTYDAGAGKTTLTSTGRCGAAQRRMVAEVYDS